MQDAYLDPRVTTELTATATEYVEQSRPDITDTYFKQRLIDLLTYQLVCLDNQSESGDIYGIKYAQYKTMYKDTLAEATADAKTAAGVSILSIPVGRS